MDLEELPRGITWNIWNNCSLRGSSLSQVAGMNLYLHSTLKVDKMSGICQVFLRENVEGT